MTDAGEAPTCAVCGGAVGPDGRYTYAAVGGAEYDVHGDCWDTHVDGAGDIGTTLAYHAASREPTFPEAAERFHELTDGHDPALVRAAEVKLAVDFMESAVEGGGGQ